MIKIDEDTLTLYVIQACKLIGRLAACSAHAKYNEPDEDDIIFHTKKSVKEYLANVADDFGDVLTSSKEHIINEACDEASLVDMALFNYKNGEGDDDEDDEDESDEDESDDDQSEE